MLSLSFVDFLFILLFLACFFFFYSSCCLFFFFFFFFQAEDGIRDHCVTGVQTCALPISGRVRARCDRAALRRPRRAVGARALHVGRRGGLRLGRARGAAGRHLAAQIGRASCRERV